MARPEAKLKELKTAVIQSFTENRPIVIELLANRITTVASVHAFMQQLKKAE